MDLINAQSAVLASLLPTSRLRRDRRGRPSRDPRDVVNGVRWVLPTGAQWQEPPDRCPSYIRPVIAGFKSLLGKT